MSAPLLLLGGVALLLMSGKKKKGGSSRGSSRNFYDLSNVGQSDDPIWVMNEMTKMASGDRLLLVVVTDKSNAGLTDYVRKTLKWGASKRSGINFALIDCRLETNPDCPNTAWDWAFGNPHVQQPLHEGTVDASFGKTVQEIVER